MRRAFDPAQSHIVIRASSSVHPIHTTAEVSGWIDLEASAGEVAFDLGAMRSGNPLIDREAERRLHIKRYPTVTGVLTAMAPGDDDPTVYDAEGELTFHGVTRTITGRLRIEERDGVIGLTGTTRIDVTDFGVQPPSLLLIKVHQHVDVDLEVFASS